MNSISKPIKNMHTYKTSQTSSLHPPNWFLSQFFRSSFIAKNLINVISFFFYNLFVVRLSRMRSSIEIGYIQHEHSGLNLSWTMSVSNFRIYLESIDDRQRRIEFSMRSLVLDPCGGYPLGFSFQKVNLEHELAVDRVHVVEGDDGLEVVAIVVLHVLSNSHGISVFVLLVCFKIDWWWQMFSWVRISSHPKYFLTNSLIYLIENC